MRIDDELRLSVSVASGRQDRAYSAEHVANVLDGALVAPRTVETISYQTPTNPAPTVYYTALLPNGNVLQARSNSGVFLENGLYCYNQTVIGITDFTAVWDEGDPADYVSERIVVDT